MKIIWKPIEELGHSGADKKKALFWLLMDGASFFVFVLGFFTVCGYVFHYPPLHRAWVEESPDMALQTGVCFTITGLVLLTIHRSKG
jgi:uncharacterized membrane protein YecN with MAPEG domain